MDLRLAYLIRNLTRNPLRAALTCLAIGLPIMILVLSIAVVAGIERFLDNSATLLRLAVTNRTSIVNPLPEGHRRKIEALDPDRTRITSVCGLHWIGGKVPNDSRPLSTIGADMDTFIATFPDYAFDEEAARRWQTDRAAFVAGAATAQQFGWKVGDRITIKPSVPPYGEFEFHVIAIGDNAADKITNFFRRDYYEELIEGTGVQQGWISFYFVKCATKADLDYFTLAIDRAFAGSSDETLTQDEKTFMNQFISQQFDLPTNVTILAVVTVFVAIMAAANTMSMNFRDRIGEYAAMKAMGFSGATVCGFVVAESIILCAVGGLVGVAVPWYAFTHTPLREVTIPLVQYLDIPFEVCRTGFLIALGVGLVAGLWPALLAVRLKVVHALRNLG